MAQTEAMSSPLRGASLSEELAYYKAQYEHLESELREFQESSRELEKELEKDIEASEKRERDLQSSLERKRFEVEEWKAKYKQSKAEATTAHAQQEREITTLREANRTVQLKIRDMEVANDDIERQARHTTSSLEDLESKYNVAIERSVLLEEEIRHVEQDREGFRIEVQRLKDELSDLRVEHEIVEEQLRIANRSGASEGGVARPFSIYSESSNPATNLSSPTISTPPPADARDGTSTAHTSPPSPSLSATSEMTARRERNLLRSSTTAAATKARASISSSMMPPPTTGMGSTANSTAQRHLRTTSRMSNGNALSTTRAPTVKSTTRTYGGRPSLYGPSEPALPRSGSLYKIQSLTQKMKTLEERVQSVRSRLPASSTTPPRARASPGISPRASPRTDGTVTAANPNNLVSNVTVRSPRKRQSQSTISSGDNTGIKSPRGVSRLSFGPTPARTPVRKGSIAFQSASVTGVSRPSSRASNASALDHSNQGRTTAANAASSQQIHPHASSATAAAGIARPRSSMAGHYGSNQKHAHGHTSRQSISSVSTIEPRRAMTPGPHSHSRTMSLATNRASASTSLHASSTSSSSSTAPTSGPLDDAYTFSYTTISTPTANRRTTLDRSSIPTPSGAKGRRTSSGAGSSIPIRQSFGSANGGVGTRRQSSGLSTYSHTQAGDPTDGMENVMTESTTEILDEEETY